MEDLAPTYLFVLHLLDDLSTGVPARASVKKYVQKQKNDFATQLLSWLILSEQGKLAAFQPEKERLNMVRRHIFDLLGFTDRGISIVPALRELELELRQLSRHQLDEHLGKLPFKMMVPLLLFQFPALLLLILGPLLLHLLKEVQ